MNDKTAVHITKAMKNGGAGAGMKFCPRWLVCANRKESVHGSRHFS
jgi:hypothetical protein